mmetsp:Transcript_102039/g.288126  ORF Transcript_102039/g.288126 Transcript_102039/m.288126 type:complete len:120 (-) Transcript_102039:41-400(-)
MVEGIGSRRGGGTTGTQDSDVRAGRWSQAREAMPAVVGAADTVYLPVVWMFTTANGLETVAQDGQDDLERHYGHFVAGRGPAQVELQFGEMHVSVDYGRMTQKVLPRGKVRSLRRMEKE